MTDPDRDRRAELIAAAVANETTGEERAELRAMAAADPTVAAEIEELRRLVGSLSPAGSWSEETPSAALRDRVAGIGAERRSDSELDSRPGAGSPVAGAPISGVSVSGDPVAGIPAAGPPAADVPAADPSPAGSPETEPRRPRRAGRPVRATAWLVAGAAACTLLGAGVTLGAQALRDAPPSGPPGTLGALERVEFEGEPAGVVIDGSLVAHTWGTETVLEIDGLAIGDSYGVVLVGDGGEELPSGTFLGSEATVLCRMNAAVMRSEVAAVEIRDEAGATVATAQLPEAAGS